MPKFESHATVALPDAPPQGRPRRGDEAFMSGVRAAQVVDASPGVAWALYLMLAALAAVLAWAALARVDEVTKAEARVVPEGREQVIASLEGGILRTLHVHEGEEVEAGQELVTLDPTRFETQQAEGETKRLALEAAIARLAAESTGREPVFPQDVLAAPQVARSEQDAFVARKRALDEAVGSNARGIELMQRELNVSESMSAKGLLSEVEVLRLRREINDLNLQSQDRINRFRQDASTELARLRADLAQLDHEQEGRQDVLRRTVVSSPVRGLVKNIRSNTVGGIIAPGAPMMEIVPIGTRTLIEARVKPGDIGFLQIGQTAKVKLAAYDFTIYGGLDASIESISPDAIGDTERNPGGPDPTYYRVMLRVDRNLMREKGRTLPVLPGMTGIAEVRIGERSVLNFLLRPMIKSKEAFRER
jgi:adhesin transport system membrane fusion protein